MASPSKVFRVFGMTGECSDLQEWSVCVCLSAKEAQVIADQCTAYASTAPNTHYTDAWERWKANNPYDPGMQHTSTGTEYGIEEIEVW